MLMRQCYQWLSADHLPLINNTVVIFSLVFVFLVTRVTLHVLEVVRLPEAPSYGRQKS